MQELIIVRKKYTPFGGAERFLSQALQQLAQDGLRIRVLCQDWEGDAPYEITRLPVMSFSRAGRDRAFSRLACTHVHASPNALVQAHERIPCCDIYRAGDGVHREWLAQRQRERGGLSSLIDRFSSFHRQALAAERRMFNSSRLRFVICNSTMVRDEIKQHYGVADEKLVVIHNGVDSRRFSPEILAEKRQQARGKLNMVDSETLFLFVGSGFERKGLRVLLQAFARLPQENRLVVVGKDRRQKKYQALAKSLGISMRVLFVGPQKDVTSFYAAADAFAFPTLYDPFPNVVMEAMASGLAVVTSTKCGATDIIENGENGLICDALDTDALTRLLQRCTDQAFADVLGRNARATVADMSYENMSRSYQELYQSLLDTTRQRGAGA